MAKQTRLRWLKLAVASIAVASCFFAQAGSAQRAAEATRAARNAALIAATEEVLKETSQIRELPIRWPVPSSAQSRAQIEEMVIRNLDAETSPADIHGDEVTMKKLGLVPPDFQYRPFMIRLLAEQVAGYYDPKHREFHLADWIDLDGQRPIMAHELTHALQDQHFDLRRFERWPKGDGDAELAAHALIEGDATLAMSLYVARDPMRGLAFLKSLGATGVASAELEKAPRVLRESLLFPYTEGREWATNLYRQDKWISISKAFTELPQSTEQILHPEKYKTHEPPVKVNLPDVSSLLDNRTRAGVSTKSNAHSNTRAPHKSSSQAPTGRQSRSLGWRRADFDVQGEWGFYLLLDQFLKAPLESKRAAAGWGGDRYAMYEGPNGEGCFISLSSWDTEADAREFFQSYAKRTDLRYPASTSPDATKDELSQVQATDPKLARLVWRGPEGIVLLERRGDRVLILEGVPTEATARALLRELW